MDLTCFKSLINYRVCSSMWGNFAPTKPDRPGIVSCAVSKSGRVVPRAKSGSTICDGTIQSGNSIVGDYDVSMSVCGIPR